MERKSYLDVLRFLAIFGVVLIHVASINFHNFGQLALVDWLASDFFHSLPRFCNPIFLMITGANLLSTQKQETLKYFFSHRYLRLVVAFLFWQIFYFIFLSHLPDLTTASGWYDFFFTDGAYHLWYMQAILLIYALIPVFRILVKNLNFKYFTYTIIVWLIISHGQKLAQFLTDTPLSLGNYAFDYGGYLLLGYGLANFNLAKIFKKLAPVVFTTVVLVMVLGNWYSFAQGEFNRYWNFDLSMGVMISGVSLFYLFKNWEASLRKMLTSQRLAKMMCSLSQCSFGIYLIHLFVLTCFQRGYFFNSLTNPMWPTPWLAIPVLSTLVFVISWGLVFLIKKIPILNAYLV